MKIGCKCPLGAGLQQIACCGRGRRAWKRLDGGLDLVRCRGGAVGGVGITGQRIFRGSLLFAQFFFLLGLFGHFSLAFGEIVVGLGQFVGPFVESWD